MNKLDKYMEQVSKLDIGISKKAALRACVRRLYTHKVNVGLKELNIIELSKLSKKQLQEVKEE